MAKPFQYNAWDTIAAIARRAKEIAFVVENAPPQEMPFDVLDRNLAEMAALREELREKIAAMPRLKLSTNAEGKRAN